jgi:hypothetical protein
VALRRIEEYGSSADKLRGIKNKEDGGHKVSGVFFNQLYFELCSSTLQ